MREVEIGVVGERVAGGGIGGGSIKEEEVRVDMVV